MAIGVNELARDLNVVARHDHLDTVRQDNRARDVGGAEVELRTIVGEERGVTAASSLVRT